MKPTNKLHKIWKILTDSNDNSCIESGYIYHAFISFTEKDKKWAKWLQWNLEHYKIPARVRSEHSKLPNRVKPVFMYENDLAGTHLLESIKTELEQSKYLIVICSPESAKKSWVNDEVRHFKDNLKRGKDIIPFVVSGELNSNNQEVECLPLPIRNLPKEEELRAIDIRVFGKKKALVNIVSTLMGLRFDVLWDRFKREQKQKITLRCIAILLCLIGLYGCWDYFLHTKYKYFVDFEDCNGVPTGIIQIKNNEAKNHYRLYRFEYRRNLLQRVAYVDCKGNVMKHQNSELIERPSIQELFYDNGDLTKIEYKDETKRILYVMNLSKDKLAADLKDENEDQAANFIYSSTSVDQGKSEISQGTVLDRIVKNPSKIGRYIYERDKYGFITKKMFAKYNGDNEDISMDANGISGFKYERDSLHRIVRIFFLDENGKYIENNLGIAGKKYNYDNNGNLIVCKYIDIKGSLRYNEQHWAKCINKYDNNGYFLEGIYFGADGKPCITSSGFNKVCVSYDDNSETFSLYDINNKPAYTFPSITDPIGAYSSVTNIYNDKGQIIEQQYKDSIGNLCNNSMNAAIMKYEYNDMGLISDIRYYGKNKKECINCFGYFHESKSYNDKGYLTEEALYNEHEKPTINILGVHRVSSTFDNTGTRIVEVHAYNQDNLPIGFSNFNGAAWIRFNYRGSSKWINEVLFFSDKNEPIETNCGAKVVLKRNDYGQVIKCEFYNAAYELSSNNDHCAIMEMEHNKNGLETDRRYYDENHRPFLISMVFHIKSVYTNTGLLEMKCNYDSLENICLSGEGWAIQKFEYNNGFKKADSFYGVNKEPIEVNGVHKCVYEYDICGNLISTRVFDSNLNPTIDTRFSAHKLVFITNINRQIVGCDYYNTSNLNKPFVRIRRKTNEVGIVIESASYNDNWDLIESQLNYGVAKIQMQYDDQNRMIYTCATNRYGQKMNTIYGFAEIHNYYGNNIIEYISLDSQNNLVDNYSFKNPLAYSITYKNDAGLSLYGKTISLYKIPTTDCYAFIYDTFLNQIQTIISYNDYSVKTDNFKNQHNEYFQNQDEYDRYVKTVDSVKNVVELKYGKPKLYNLATKI